MKTLTTITTLFFVLFFVTLNAQSVSKTVLQTFTVGQISSLTMDAENAKVEIRETKGTRVLVETTVRLSVPNEGLLQFVMDGGRYDLIEEYDQLTGELTLAAKKTNNVLVSKGKECSEEITHVVYLPESIEYFKDSTAQHIVERD